MCPHMPAPPMQLAAGLVMPVAEGGTVIGPLARYVRPSAPWPYPPVWQPPPPGFPLGQPQRPQDNAGQPMSLSTQGGVGVGAGVGASGGKVGEGGAGPAPMCTFAQVVHTWPG